MTSSVVGLRRSSKVLPKAKLAPKKGHGYCLVVYCPSNPLQLFGSWRNHYIWEVCSADWCNSWNTAMPAAGIGQQNGPSSSPGPHLTTRRTTSTSELNKLGYKVLPHPPYLPDLLPTDYYFFKHLDNFLLGKRSHSQQEAENASCEAWFFYATGINLFLVGKNVFIVML